MVQDAGNSMYKLAQKLFPICRSITGNGVRETLAILKEICPCMDIFEVPTGTKAFDWDIPKEWNIRDAWIKDPDGNTIIDFNSNNLHVVGYSLPVNKKINLEELKKHIHTEPEQPDVIPYVTSYYKEEYGFCMSENLKNSLKEGNYHIFIDSELKDGSLTFGEIRIPASDSNRNEEEVFLSTYICHPSMANNELSGPCVAIHLAKWISEMKDRRYNYRIIFIPETIGAITYLSRNLEIMKKNIIAGFNISCVGDDRTFSYVASRYGNTLADKTAKNVLNSYYPDYQSYSYLRRGSDERQYNAPGVDLPICGICRSKYGEYPEYHTSADNMDLISPAGLEGAFEVYKRCILAIENNFYYKSNFLCEPQLGRRGLYPTISRKGSVDSIKEMLDILAYADGRNDLIDISNIINVSVDDMLPIIRKLLEHKVISRFEKSVHI